MEHQEKQLKKEKLDLKDYKILRELDKNYRTSFSQIAKKVGLSKNSVALRFEKLKSYIIHSTVGINNEMLGYKLVKIYYTFDFYNEKIELEIINELKKHKNILWAARFYGPFDVSICLLVKDINDLVTHVTEFNDRFSKHIREKQIQIIHKQFFFRHDYIHENPINMRTEIHQTNKRYVLSKIDKKILSAIRNNPRTGIIEISKKIKISPKTISMKLKDLEKNKIITGYFMTLNNSKFNLNLFKLLIQTQNAKKIPEFEDCLCAIKNLRHFRKMLGLWDYEIDIAYPSMDELHKQIEIIKQKFPKLIKRIAIVGFGKRIITNKEIFLE